MKPPALFSVDLSNVPAASCSIIMVSSPLLLHRRCLSSLSLLLLLLFSSYCFLFSLSFSAPPYLPRRDPCLVLLLVLRSQSQSLSLLLSPFFNPPLRPTSQPLSSVVRRWLLVEARPSVTRITRIASKTANNKCFSALRNRRKIRAAVISPRRFPRNGAAAVSRKIVCARFSFIYSRRRRRKKERKEKKRTIVLAPPPLVRALEFV